MTLLAPGSVYMFTVYGRVAGTDPPSIQSREVTIFTCGWGEAIWGWNELFRDCKGNPVFLTLELYEALIARVICQRDGFELEDFSVHHVYNHKGDECAIECIKELQETGSDTSC